MERLWPERGVHLGKTTTVLTRSSRAISKHWLSFLKMTCVSASRMPHVATVVPRRLSSEPSYLAVNFDGSSDGMIDRVTAGTEVYRSPYPAKIPGHGPTGAFDSINQITKATPMSQAYRRPVMMLPLRRPPPRGDRQSLSTP